MRTAVDIRVTSFGTYLSSPATSSATATTIGGSAFAASGVAKTHGGETARSGGNTYLQCLPEADYVSLDKWRG